MKECPNCRANLKTGEKKIENNIISLNKRNNNNRYGNININNNSNNARNNGQDSGCNLILIILFIFICFSLGPYILDIIQALFRIFIFILVIYFIMKGCWHKKYLCCSLEYLFIN